MDRENQREHGSVRRSRASKAGMPIAKRSAIMMRVQGGSSALRRRNEVVVVDRGSWMTQPEVGQMTASIAITCAINWSGPY